MRTSAPQITAVLAAIGKSRNAWRAALVHVLVNVIGALAWIGFIGTLADLAKWIGGDQGARSRKPTTVRQCAHRVQRGERRWCFLTVLGPLVALTDKLVPASVGTHPVAAARPAFLDRDYLSTPMIALEMTRRELLRLGLRVRSMLVASVPAATAGTRRELTDIRESDEEVDALHAAVVSYLGDLSRGDLSHGQRC